MRIEYYNKANELRSKISYLNDLLDRTEGCSPSCGLEIIVKTGYSDMGHDITRSMQTRDDLATDIWYMVREHIKGKINKLETEFENL